MRRPWHIWLVYLLCLAIVLPAMAWLTSQTWQADRLQWQAHVTAQREETINSVLWQMDTQLTSLLAQEAARPHFVYSSFYAAPAVVTEHNRSVRGPLNSKAPASDEAEWSRLQLPSPLLSQPSPYVVLHFQLDSKGKITSPQVPTGALEALALDNGAVQANIRSSGQHMAELRRTLDYTQLLAALPAERMPEVGVGQWQVFNPGANVQPNAEAYVGNTLEYPQVKEQLDAAQVAQSENQSQGPSQQAVLPNAAGGNYAGFGYGNRSQSRAGNDLQQRNQAYQQAAQRQVVEQRLNLAVPQLKYVSEGVSRPVWIDSHFLLLARRVKVGDDELVQGCWLDWPKLRNELQQQYRSELPELTLEPVTPATQHLKVGRMLATLPVQMHVPELSFPTPPWSPLLTALAVAWGMLAVAAGAVAILLQGVITLSERRGAFVSAVTHELRTPLTTFRMYAEMLAENMVPSAETRQRYLETLRVEADRLSHLVENVLAYAKLERGRHGRRREATDLIASVQNWQQRFADRALQAGMELVVESSTRQGEIMVATDPTAVEQIVFNLIDNACKYAAGAADRRIHLELALAGKQAVLRVRDHGPGIDSKAARRLFQPFSKSVHDAACSAPGVGLGLALSRRLAHELGGRLELETNTSGATFALYLPR